MKREKLKLLMALLVLAAAWILSREVAVPVSQMHVLNPRKTGEFCVVIDPGHGGGDPGKVSDDGILEKDVNLAIALRLKNLLEEYGVPDIVESVNGKRRLAAEKVQCDLYDYLSGREEFAQLFKGSYLTNYSWGENTLAELTGEHFYGTGE